MKQPRKRHALLLLGSDEITVTEQTRGKIIPGRINAQKDEETLAEIGSNIPVFIDSLYPAFGDTAAVQFDDFLAECVRAGQDRTLRLLEKHGVKIPKAVRGKLIQERKRGKD